MNSSNLECLLIVLDNSFDLIRSRQHDIVFILDLRRNIWSVFFLCIFAFKNIQFNMKVAQRNFQRKSSSPVFFQDDNILQKLVSVLQTLANEGSKVKMLKRKPIDYSSETIKLRSENSKTELVEEDEGILSGDQVRQNIGLQWEYVGVLLLRASRNLLTIYRKCCSLIGYRTRYLSVDKLCLQYVNK